MNLLGQTYDLLWSNTVIQLHESVNLLRQNTSTKQEENQSFMVATQNHIDLYTAHTEIQCSKISSQPRLTILKRSMKISV